MMPASENKMNPLKAIYDYGKRPGQFESRQLWLHPTIEGLSTENRAVWEEWMEEHDARFGR